MKNISTIKILLGLFLFVFNVFGSSNDVFATEGILDQQCRTTTSLQASMSITNRTDLLQQTFTPTQDRLTQVNILVDGDGVGTVTLWIVQNTDTGVYYINSDGPLPEPNGKAMMNFHFNDVVMIPNTSYTILPNASDNDSKLEWYYQENCYDRGVGYMGVVPNSFDFSFQTYSFASEIPITSTPIIIFSATNTPTPTITSTPTVKTETTPSVTVVPTSSITPILEKDPEIPIPSLEYVLNDLQKEENMGATIELNETSDFVLYGKGEPGSTVLIVIGEKNFETVVDKNGFWYLKIPMTEIPGGMYTVKGQTQINGQGSELVDLINVNVKDKPIEDVVKQAASQYSNYYPYALGLLAIIIGLVLLALYFARKDNKQKKTEEGKDQQKENVTDAVTEGNIENKSVPEVENHSETTIDSIKTNPESEKIK